MKHETHETNEIEKKLPALRVRVLSAADPDQAGNPYVSDVSDVIHVQGRDIGTGDIALIKDLIHSNPNWKRTRLSHQLCLCWNWRNAAGHLKDMSCRILLRKLEKMGYVELPGGRNDVKQEYKLPLIKEKNITINKLNRLLFGTCGRSEKSARILEIRSIKEGDACLCQESGLEELEMEMEREGDGLSLSGSALAESAASVGDDTDDTVEDQEVNAVSAVSARLHFISLAVSMRVKIWRSY